MERLAMSATRIVALVASAGAFVATGLYVAGAADAPGAAVLGLLLMAGGVVLGIRAVRGWLPVWAARTALAVGVVAAIAAAFHTHAVVIAAPPFGEASAVPSISGTAAAAPSAPVERARDIVRAAMVEEHLPGVSVAIGVRDAVVWAEGFGWRDVVTRAPVTPSTRFHIGTAASAVRAFVAPLDLSDTGADSAAEWSPEHIGEPEEDFPGFTLIRHVVFRPLGLAPATPLPGDRATFYVPRAGDDPRRGRRLMYMRDLACCADGMAFSSTPSDLVRFGLATQPASLDGALAGGLVMSLTREPASGVVVVVASNITHADTAAVARRIGEVFAGWAR